MMPRPFARCCACRRGGGASSRCPSTRQRSGGGVTATTSPARSTATPFAGRCRPWPAGWVLPVGALWCQDPRFTEPTEVAAELRLEGPQRDHLADDVAEALAAHPDAAAFWDSLATFYRKGYLRWIDATKRRPELRAARIAEMIALLRGGHKQRPRS